ncbi:MAG: hypothetical protein CMA25_04780 [Euryarchaeota archaeon]|nr:hypothetical protein [Euryarchaeota archaeon]
MWIGLDDTDSLLGGCTTYTFHQVLCELDCEILELRLVRLYPFAQRRTRGNAAVAAKIIPKEQTIDDLDRIWTEMIEPLKGKIAESEHDNRKQYPSEPGMVVYQNDPDPEYYWTAVRRQIDYLPTPVRAWGGWGMIGAAAACAWKGTNATYESIAWRKNMRAVDEKALIEVDHIDGTFLCRDPRLKQGLLAPRGPCPVMFGLRAFTVDIAESATKKLISAPGTAEIEGWRIFKTNQASGDHLAMIHKGKVEEILVKKGGHVIVQLEHDIVIAFGETGDVKLLAQSLVSGDCVEYVGLRASDGSIHLEGLRKTHSYHQERPLCSCGKRMKSMGKNQGSRCPSCRTIIKKDYESKLEYDPEAKWTMPPLNARRHLSKLDLNQNSHDL